MASPAIPITPTWPTSPTARERPVAPHRRIGARLRRWLQAAAPASPVFMKEMAASGRKWRAYNGRLGYVLLLLVVLAIAYMVAVADREHQTGVAGVQMVQTFAPVMTIVIGWVQFIALSFIAPVTAAPVFVDERRSGTLATLLTTPLSAFQIVLGKLAACVLQLLLTALLAVPILLIIRVFGGVATEAILKMTAVTLAVMLQGACIGLFYSTRCKRTNTASALSLFTLILMQVGPIIGMVMFMYFASRIGVGNATAQVVFGYLAGAASPIIMGFLTASDLSGSTVPMLGALDVIVPLNIAINLGTGALFFAGAVASARRAMWSTAEHGPVSATPKKPRRSRGAKADAAVTPADPAPADPSVPSPGSDAQPTGAVRSRRPRRVHHASTVDVGDNPIRWRELRQAFFRSPAQAAGAVILVVALLFAFHLIVDESDAVSLMTVFGMVSAMLIAAVTSAGGIASERESRTFDTLLTTPASARTIIFGKFWGGLRRQWFLPTITLLELLLFGCVAHGYAPVAMINVSIILVMTIGLIVALGQLASVLIKLGSSATVISFGLMLFFCGGFLGLWAGFGALHFEVMSPNGKIPPLYEGVTNFGVVTNPVFLAVVALDGAQGTGQAWADRPYDLEVWSRYTTAEFSGHVLAVAVGYAALTFGILWLASRILAAKTYRRV